LKDEVCGVRGAENIVEARLFLGDVVLMGGH